MGKHLSDGDDLRYDGERRPLGLVRTVALALGIAFVVGAVSTLVASIVNHKPVWVEALQPTVPSPEDLFQKDRILVLLMGKDYDYNDKDEETSKNSRSDVIKVFALDFTRKTVSELAIPRDMDVVLPNGSEAKINEALEDGGVPEAQAVIAKFLDIPGFDRFVVLRINSTKALIDAIGGIDVRAAETMDYDDNWGHLHIHFVGGKLYHMSGNQAVSYARFRHDECGDPCRIQRQQQVERIIFSKLRTNKIADIAYATRLIGTVQHNVDTNFSSEELISLALAFADMQPGAIQTAQVPYVDTKDIAAGNVLIPDEVAREQLVQKLLVAPPVTEPSPDQQQLAAVSPSSIKVDVLNGTGIAGEARRVATMLQKKGFVIGNVGNATGESYAATEIHEHTMVTFAGAKVRAALAPALKTAPLSTDPTASPGPESDVTVIVGKDLSVAQTPSR